MMMMMTMMTTTTMMMVMVIMTMMIVSVEQRPGWGEHVSSFQVPANLGQLVFATTAGQVSECSFILVDDDVQSCHSWTMI